VSFNHEQDPPTGVSAAQPLSRPRLLQGQVARSRRGRPRPAPGMPYDSPAQSTFERSARMRSSWFAWVLAVPPTLAALVTLVVQSRSKWAVLRRVRLWPGVQRMLDVLGRPFAWWEFRRLPTTPPGRRSEPPPSPPR
jgi:hypothetical protein